jgi:hypothetical protein
MGYGYAIEWKEFGKEFIECWLEHGTKSHQSYDLSSFLMLYFIALDRSVAYRGVACPVIILNSGTDSFRSRKGLFIDHANGGGEHQRATPAFCYRNRKLFPFHLFHYFSGFSSFIDQRLFFHSANT